MIYNLSAQVTISIYTQILEDDSFEIGGVLNLDKTWNLL